MTEDRTVWAVVIRERRGRGGNVSTLLPDAGKASIEVTESIESFMNPCDLTPLRVRRKLKVPLKSLSSP